MLTIFTVENIAAALIGLVGLLFIFRPRWQVAITGLMILYIGEFILTYQVWSLQLSLVKLVAGLISALILGIGAVSSPSIDIESQQGSRSGQVFRIIVSITVIIVIYSIVPRASEWIPALSPSRAFGGLLMIGLGLLNVGIGAGLFSSILGLLTMIGGFEILYATVENSALVAGLLGMINMGISMVGAYLLPDASKHRLGKYE